MKRRDFLKKSVIGSAVVFGFKANLLRAGILPDGKIPIALQLYSVRKDCAEDFDLVLEKVASMGFEGVEFAGYYHYRRDPKGLKKRLDDLGLKVAGTHIRTPDITGEKLKLIRQRSPAVVQEYHDKLKKRAEELLSGTHLKIDAEILAREVAVFADRCDIAEELTRLDSHVRQFVEICQNSNNTGRRLDFISQEMLREANTIASKASDSRICQWVVDIKCAIDRIKEQVQNIE